MGSVVDYTVAFRAILLEYSNASDAKALDQYLAGLKPTTQDWVLIHDPTMMHQAIKWAEKYNNTYFSKSRMAASSSAQPGTGNLPGNHRQLYGSRYPSGKP